jgi:hypothetical protein
MKNKVKNAIKESKEEKESLFKEIKFKSQAAMEYLMTYGWAILIIALTLAVLYSLGIMNPKNFIPRAPPGSCFVFRPNGPGTTDFVSLQGTCGYLPMYVASFNGVDSYINVPSFTVPNTHTISFWMKLPYVAPGYWRQILACKSDSNDRAPGIWTHASYPFRLHWKYNPNNVGFDNVGPGGEGTDFSPDTWYYVAGVKNGTTLKFYVNGRYIASTTVPDPILLGTYLRFGRTNYYPRNMSLANVQIYSTALTPQEIQYLYQQGLGGGPVRLQNLVGWWPLNGDAKDYSGNNNHGTIYGGVTFVQNYNPP